MKTLLQNFSFPTPSPINNLPQIIYAADSKTPIVINDVIMLEGDGNYTHVHFSNGKKILLSKTLKKFCELFQQNGFARIGKSHLVNLNYLRDVDFSGNISVTMQTGERIGISRRRKASFQEQFQQFNQKNEGLSFLKKN